MRVLLVEDETRLARLVAEGLEAHGFSVDVEHDGLDGLTRAQTDPFDAIILDILLPGMNGYKICATLRAEEVWTPILMLTAKDGEWDETEALDTGADDYLRKPFSLEVLAARLRALVRRGASARPVKLEIGSLVLDPASRVASRNGSGLDLTRREFDLLEALALASPDAVPKHELLDKVWGTGFDGSVNVVEVYVRYLRNKIDQPFGLDTVTTVRGVGYALEPDA